MTCSNLLQKICAWLHLLPLHQKHIYTDLPPPPASSLEQFLRAIWQLPAVSRTIVLILPPIKLNSQLSRCAFFFFQSTLPFLNPKQKASCLQSHSRVGCGPALRRRLWLFRSFLLCACTFALRSSWALSPNASLRCSGMFPSGNKCTAPAKGCLFLCWNRKEPRNKAFEKVQEEKEACHPGKSLEFCTQKIHTSFSEGNPGGREGQEETFPINRMQHQGCNFFSGVDFWGERAVINCGQHPCPSRSRWQWPQRWAACWKLTKAGHVQSRSFSRAYSHLSVVPRK